MDSVRAQRQATLHPRRSHQGRGRATSAMPYVTSSPACWSCRSRRSLWPET